MSEAPQESAPKDAARVRFPPPFIFLIATLGGALVQQYAWPLPLALSGPPALALAALLAAAGVLLMLAAFGRFKATGQDPKPWKPTPEIIAGGIYRYTRNPMYLSMALLQGAIGVGLGNLWISILVPLSLAAVYFMAVRHEERYLEGKFGRGYLDYKNKVRRWI